MCDRENLTLHPDLFEVVRKNGDFTSELRIKKDFAASQEICKIEGTINSGKAWSSVQVKDFYGQDEPKDAHIELQSDLVYVNHSCDPNVAFSVPQDKSKWAVKALKDLKANDVLTFAYFSTEWDMAQPFECRCGSEKCLGTIQGAKYLSNSVLDGYFLNDHIKSMLGKRNQHEKLPN